VTLTPAVSQSIEILATVTGVGYAVLAARRSRLCWVAGAVSSTGAALLAGMRGLPMQSGLQVFFVLMSLYGWLNWTRSAGEGELPVGRWPVAWHAGAAVAIILLSLASARLLAA
jgi:nicotinamide mononucleotide transporter